jgi:hypothetical protein
VRKADKEMGISWKIHQTAPQVRANETRWERQDGISDQTLGMSSMEDEPRPMSVGDGGGGLAVIVKTNERCTQRAPRMRPCDMIRSAPFFIFYEDLATDDWTMGRSLYYRYFLIIPRKCLFILRYPPYIRKWASGRERWANSSGTCTWLHREPGWAGACDSPSGGSWEHPMCQQEACLVTYEPSSDVDPLGSCAIGLFRLSAIGLPTCSPAAATCRAVDTVGLSLSDWRSKLLRIPSWSRSTPTTEFPSTQSLGTGSF